MQPRKVYDKNSILQKFNISSATLDNWIRTSIPNARNGNEYDVYIIENFIKNTNKLKSMANKKSNTDFICYSELLKYLNNDEWVSDFIKIMYKMETTDIANEIVYLYENRLLGIEPVSYLSSIIPHNDFYSYSVAYQILLNSGDKSKMGAYYTPKFIVQGIVESLVERDKKFLEPCCGVGFYTIEYIIAYKNKFNCFPDGLIYSNEIDPISAEITRLNIINLTKDKMPNFTVTCGDGLTLPYNDIDLIITNPPYGIKCNYSMMKTKEIFSHFIHKSLHQYLSKNGKMNFVLPSSVLSIERHKEIRKYILTKHTLESVKYYGKSFDGVFSDIVSIQITNKEPKNNTTLLLNDEVNRVPQIFFEKNDYKITNMSEEDIKFIEGCYNFPHFRLSDEIATFAMGIVTGNNSNFIFDEIPKQQYKEIISGKEVSLGNINYQRKKYILDAPSKYQQKPDMSLFLNKKIIYKFISNSIISAVDTSGILTLNSANFILLKNGIEEEYVSALLNSKLVNHIYRMKFGNPLKVLKTNIQELPIFIFSSEINKQIVDNYKNGLHLYNDLIIEDNIKNYISQK